MIKSCYWYPIQGEQHRYSATCQDIAIPAWFGVMISEIKYCPFCGGRLNPKPSGLSEAAK